MAMDAYHLKFNQSDGSISLTLQTGFLAKNEVPYICPDHIVISHLAVAKGNVQISFYARLEF